MFPSTSRAQTDLIERPATSSLSIREWDGQWVVFDRLSGDTHLVNELGVALLKQLPSGTMPADALLTSALSNLNLPADTELMDAGRTTLTRLIEQGFLRLAAS